jgi:hypothetical protein
MGVTTPYSEQSEESPDGLDMEHGQLRLDDLRFFFARLLRMTSSISKHLLSESTYLLDIRKNHYI